MFIEINETEMALVMEYRRKVEALTKLILFAQKNREEDHVC